MLSNQTPNFNPGRQQRQNSTPDIFANNETRLTANNLHPVSHRRGLSLDQPINTQPQSTHGLRPQDILNCTPRGFEHYQRHLLQEAQKQQQLAGPGLPAPRPPSNEQGSPRNIALEPYPEYGRCVFTNDLLISDPTILNDATSSKYLDTTDRTGICYEQHSFATTDFAGYLNCDESAAGQNLATAGRNMKTRQNSVLKGNEAVDLTTMNLSSQAGLVRPCTPQNQTNSCYFPLTPDATPFSRAGVTEGASGNHDVESPTKDPNLTIKASHAMKRGASFQDIFINPISTEAIKNLSPPNSERLYPVKSIDLADFPDMDLMDLSTMNLNFLTKPISCKPCSYSPTSKTISSNNSSFCSSPDVASPSSFESSPEIKNSRLCQNPGLPSSKENLNSRNPPRVSEFRSYSPLPKQSSHSRSQSISDLDIGATVEDTGISSEEIAAYISGPDPFHGRWACTYPDCHRSFGRKENIKSHVQTHLGDRQYRCVHCGNTFVRQHDLKRHAKIHSGIKPYPCPCGSSFARHDALTRHRQRNTCVGGFEGICKSPTKRGRPRKYRPDVKARQSKAEKTRQWTRAKASSASPVPCGTSIVEDLPELPPSQPMSRETSTSYCSTSSDIDLFPSLSSPLPTFDFGFDLGSMGVLEAPSLASSPLLDLDDEIGLMLLSTTEVDDITSLERELMEQLDQFNGALTPLPEDF